MAPDTAAPETAVCPKCGHAIDGLSPHPPECARCPEGYCEAVSTDPASATLTGIKERRASRAQNAPGLGAPPADFDRLLAAVEAVLKEVDEWAAESDRLDDLAEKPGTDEEARPIMQGQALAYNSCVGDLREAIRAALTGEEAGDGT